MEKKKQGMIVTSVLLICLILVVIGVSFAFFTYSRQGSKENTITTGSLTFVYDEKKAEGNGITLSNAFPMSDEDGKGQSGDNNVFDFQVLATTQGESISYEVIGKKEDSSTLPENVTKIYLTTLSGSEESEVATTVKDGVVTTYDELSDTQIEDQTGKTLYQEVIPLNQTGYQKNFRLRMWLSEEANTTTNGSWDYNNKTFTIRINVVANGEGVTITTPSYTDTSGANAPELVEGMIPVVYDEEKSSWVKQDLDKSYAYQDQIWANAVTVTEENRATYMSAPAGTEISMEDINTMWVWIPRYEYQYTNLGDQYAGGTQDLPGEIKINFLSGTSTTPSDATNYKVHPAFTFGTDQLTGLWYAKFETSLLEQCIPKDNAINANCDLTSFTPQIKPSVTSWRGARISTFFQSIRGMQISKYATYGFANDTSYDIHMSKNSEWGAVAYLSQSKYGKYGNPNYTGADKEVAINNCSNYITGIGGDTVSAPSSNTTCTTNTYETAKGQAASTAGNITGVYDMSGGTWEYMMGVLADSSGAPRSGHTETYNSGFNGMLNDGSQYTNGINFPESKYYDLYENDDSTNHNGDLSKTGCKKGICYGHALSEVGTSSSITGWYNDFYNYVFDTSPWFPRGGYYVDQRGAGIFSTHYNGGGSGINRTTRIVLISA